jgi:hypothetical protein
MHRDKLNKLFDEHFINDCDEVYDAHDEIINFAEKAITSFVTSVLGSPLQFCENDLKKAVTMARSGDIVWNSWIDGTVPNYKFTYSWDDILASVHSKT